MTSQPGSSHETADDVFRNAQFSSSSSSSYGSDFQSAEQILAGNVASLHPLAQMSDKELDYLALEDDRLNTLEGTRGVLPSRGWGDELCYGTGSTYLTGLATGGLWGLREGLFKPLYKPSSTVAGILNQQKATFSAAAEASTVSSSAAAAAPTAPLRTSAPFRLRLNTVLNAMTSRGIFVGNNAGVLALIYNGINSSIDKYRGRHDIYGSMAAGAGTGLLWRSTAGLKPMLIASGSLTVMAAAWTKFKDVII